MIRQFTATVYIIENEKTLLLFHPKIGKWLPPGGHVEENEIPPDCARREAKEETGLEVALLPQENLWIEHPNATSFSRPFLCLLENVPPHGSHPAHQHIDFIYVGIPVGGQVTEAHRALQPIRWFTLEEVFQLEAEKEIFLETQQTLQTIFAQRQRGLLSPAGLSTPPSHRCATSGSGP